MEVFILLCIRRSTSSYGQYYTRVRVLCIIRLILCILLYQYLVPLREYVWCTLYPYITSRMYVYTISTTRNHILARSNTREYYFTLSYVLQIIIHPHHVRARMIHTYSLVLLSYICWRSGLRTTSPHASIRMAYRFHSDCWLVCPIDWFAVSI